MKSIESGPSSPEYTKDEIMEYIKEEYEKAREVADEKNRETKKGTGQQIEQQGINMKTMRNMMEALEMTGYEAFSSPELSYIVEMLDLVIIEVDPVYKSFYKNLKQRLTDIIEDKKNLEELYKRTK